MEVLRSNKSDKVDRETEIYQQGFLAGREHQGSSPETLNKLAKMGEDINELKISSRTIDIKLENICKMLEEHIREEAVYREKQEVYHKSILEAKADRRDVEDLKDNQKWVVRTIIGIVIVAVVSLIIVNK